MHEKPILKQPLDKANIYLSTVDKLTSYFKFNSIQFRMYLLTCKFNNTSANYKVSTKIYVQQKSEQIH